MKTYERWFPRCKHDYPADDLTRTEVTGLQLMECQEDVERIDDLRGQDHHKMGFRARPDALVIGQLAEQVFANICGVARDRSMGLPRCSKCRREHGPPDFPTWLDVKAKGSVDPIELVVNKGTPQCFERFAMVEVHHSHTYGNLWIVAPAWRVKMGEDVRRGRHRFNPRSANWTLDAWALRRELEAHTPRDCMICGPEWSTKGIQKNAVEAIADMRRVLGKRGGKV